MNKGISIIESLDFSLGTVDVKESKKRSALRNHYIREVKDFGIDKIYFSGEFPSVYFKKVKNFESDAQREILAIHKKIWNQGKVPFLYVESPFEIRIYNCYEKPVEPKQEDRQIGDIELYQTTLNDLSVLKRVFDKISIETGFFWKEKKYAKQVKNEFRVEEELIKNLKKTREILKKELPLPLIHNLLLRSLFILYLEDRKATDAKFYKRITGIETGTSYFEILKSKKGTYRLFEELDDKFNGNLSPVSKEEQKLVTPEHLLLIRECFWAEIRRDGQISLFEDWRLFNFEIIPIQLLSEIYEEFLGVEDPKGKAKTGAFYTPHPLAEFVLNEMLPYSNSKKTLYNVKTLDPTCGSGIFLVETLNRLLDRWETAHPKEQLTFDIICQIVKDNIFGIEINKEAIKVAAFSIYLAMLNRLNPKTLWQNRRFPYLIYDPDEKDEDKQGQNLFRMSSLGSGPFEELNIDLVVGNPPFGTKKLSTEVKDYVESRGFATEAVLAFLHRVTKLSPNGKIALLTTTKILLNNKNTYQNFREFLFKKNHVEKVVNLSILGKVPQEQGKKYLPKASVPISIIFYTSVHPEKRPKRLEYWAPKTAIKNRFIDGIAVDQTDIKYLPREECLKPDSNIWKAAMWGTERDFYILKNLLDNKSINDTIIENNWKMGVGFQTSEPTHLNKEIKKIPHLPTNNLDRYYTPIENTKPIEIESFERLGAVEAYKAPHLLIKEGFVKKEIGSSFVDYDCSFRKSILGIYANNEFKLKLLSAYINSDLFKYFLFLTSNDWGIERYRIMPNELLELPDLTSIFSIKTQNLIVKLFDQILKIKKAEFLNLDIRISKIEKEINEIIKRDIDFSFLDIIIIEDFLNFTLDAFQNKQKSIAYHPTQLKENKLYAEYLCKTINEFLEYDNEIKAWATVFDLSHRIPLNVVVLYLNNIHEADAIIDLPEKEVGAILKSMEQHSYKEYAESIYFRRFFRYYDEDKIYIIKPNEKRFWSRSMAINDADEIIVEIQNQLV